MTRDDDTDDESTPDVRAEDALQIAQRAMQKAHEVDDLKDEVDELRDELAAVKLRLSEQDDDRSYESLSLEEKVGLVREYGYKKASNGHGKATLDYDDIMWGVFDGEPGTHLCYKLIRLAAGLSDERKTGSEKPGFTARDPSGDTYHLAIDSDAAKRDAAFCSQKKTPEEVAP